MRRFILFTAFLIISAVSVAQVFYKEPYRPQYHFTPPVNWTNDPNGLVFYKGEYHLFYQYNPMGIRWGHMSWGHAISKDLVHWEHLPVAIPEEKDTMIFSGSCVVDIHNTGGFAKEPGQVPIVAIYTGHIEGMNQSQHIAYSLDDGRTWTKYNANPVLDLHKKDFRDPKVFWYQDKWVMAVMWPIERQVQFYQSKNLKQWELMSVFGPAGDTTGIWECPDLFQVPVEDEPGKSKWVFMHSPAPYMQYFVGEFDGTRFINESNTQKIYRPDYGPDYYAAITFNHLPAGQKPVSIGWSNNWNYAQNIPTTPWRSMMSLSRELSVKNIDGEWILMQNPVNALEQLRTGHHEWEAISTNNYYTLPLHGQTIELKLNLTPTRTGISGVRLAVEGNRYIEVGFEAGKKLLYIDRSHSGINDFDSAYIKQSRYETLLHSADTLELRLFLDKSILEVYANSGEAVFSMQLFPGKKENGIVLFSEGGKTVFNTIDFWKLESIW